MRGDVAMYRVGIGCSFSNFFHQCSFEKLRFSTTNRPMGVENVSIPNYVIFFTLSDRPEIRIICKSVANFNGNFFGKKL